MNERRGGSAGTRHVPVMLDEVLSVLTPASAGVARPRLVDCTLGGGGHARALLEAFPEAELLGLDRDPAAVERTRQVLEPFAGRVDLVVSDHRELARIIQKKTGPGRSRDSSPTSGSRATSSTIPAAASRSSSRVRSTCGWTRPATSRRPPTSFATCRRTSSCASSVSTGTSRTRAGSREPSSIAAGRIRP